MLYYKCSQSDYKSKRGVIMALRKYRKTEKRFDLTSHYGTKSGLQQRCAELELLTKIVQSKSFDRKKGSTLFPLSNVTKTKGQWISDYFGKRNPFGMLRKGYRKIVELGNPNGMGFKGNNAEETGEENYLLNQQFCVPVKPKSMESFLTTTGKGSAFDLVVAGYPVDIKGMATLKSSRSWATRPKTKTKAYLDNKRIDLGVGVSALLQMRMLQQGLPVFVVLTNDEGGFILNITELYWNSTPLKSFAGQQSASADIVTSFLKEHSLSPLRDGHGMRRGFVYTTSTYSTKNGRDQAHHNLSRDVVVNGETKRKGVRLRINTSEIGKQVSASRNGYRTTDDGLAMMMRCASAWMSPEVLAEALASGDVIRSMAKESRVRINALMKT